MVATVLNQRAVWACQRTLDEWLAANDQVKSALVATQDGFEVAACGVADEQQQARLAAMSSSLLALSHSVTDEVLLPGCDSLMIDGINGKLLIMAVPGSAPDLLLTVVSQPQAAMGRLLMDARFTAMVVRRQLLNHAEREYRLA
ncbi:MAG: hypothetical protein Tsb002_22010 [Wenzhouxiangellaceae bacterium]